MLVYIYNHSGKDWIYKTTKKTAQITKLSSAPRKWAKCESIASFIRVLRSRVMISPRITAIILLLGGLFVSLPSVASAIELVANEPATIYYTTNGEEPTTTDVTITTIPEFNISALSGNVFDGYYTLASATTTWDGTDADRLRLPTADYTSSYGDESSVTYTLPWSFSFYGQSFTQITVDTNGNVWFGSAGSAHSFNLASNGRSPVIAAWNNDLSSYLTGGVFIQHKTSPERIVIEWQTETFTDEGRRRPHNFEVVLFQTGNIRLDYGSFTTSTTNTDFGSGVSLNDGTMYINLTTNAGNAYSLGGQSFLLSVNGTTKTLDVGFPTGSYGIVNSNIGASWSASSVKTLPTGTHVVLTAAPLPGFKLNNWSGACTGTGTCSFTLSSNTVANANFSYDSAQNALVAFPNGTSMGYFSLQSAYNAALTDSILKLRAATFIETVIFNQSKSVTIKGGFNNDFSSNAAGQSIINGTVTIFNGTLIFDNITIRSSDASQSLLTVSSSGTGTGTVTSSLPNCIDCGTTCSSFLTTGTFVTLTATPSPDSVFAGWTGACSGTGSCPLTVSSNTSVTATFNKILNFDVTTSGADLMTATFTIPTQGATSWLWNFGDGITSTVQNPTHLYNTPGDYTVSLTTNNYSVSKLVSIVGCTNPKVRISGDQTVFTSIQSAYNAATGGSVIQIRGVEFTETLTAARDISVTFNGGYNCDFSANSGTTVIHGSPRISAGTVKFGNIRFSQ